MGQKNTVIDATLQRKAATDIFQLEKFYDHCGVWVGRLKEKERERMSSIAQLHIFQGEKITMLVVNLIAHEQKHKSGTGTDSFVLFEKALNTDI